MRVVSSIRRERTSRAQRTSVALPLMHLGPSPLLRLSRGLASLEPLRTPITRQREAHPQSRPSPAPAARAVKQTATVPRMTWTGHSSILSE